jgi:hypothetical protein
VHPRGSVIVTRGRYVTKGRRGQSSHCGEERSPVRLTVRPLNRSRTHLQREEYLARWSMETRVYWAPRVKFCRDEDQHAGPRVVVDRVGDGNYETPFDLIEGRRRGVTGNSRRLPCKRGNSAEPNHEYCETRA